MNLDIEGDEDNLLPFSYFNKQIVKVLKKFQAESKNDYNLFIVEEKLIKE